MEGISLLHDQGNAYSYAAWTKNVKKVKKEKKTRETGSFPVEFFATNICEILMWILDLEERRAAVEVEEKKEI